MLIAIIALIAILVVSAILVQSNSTDGNKWLKFAIAYVYLRWTKRKPLFDFKIVPNDLGRLGVVSLPIAWTKDKPRPLLPSIHAVDSIRMWGTNKDGVLLYIQMSHRHNRVGEISLLLRIDDKEYQLPIHPDTTVYNTNNKCFSASGLSLELLEPLRRWSVKFDGYLRRKSDGEIVTAKFNFLCIPTFNYTSFPEDFNTRYVAAYLAECNIKPWEIYDKLSVERQALFSQLHGLIDIQGQEQREVLLRGIKERTHGCIEWRKLDHLVYIEVKLEVGTAVRIIIENNKHGVEKFVHGYLCPPCNQTLLHMTQITVDLEKICSSSCPSELDIHFKAGKSYHLHLKSRNGLQPFQTYLGEERTALSELLQYDVTLNGRLGDGIIHFITNHVGDHRHPSPSLPQSSLPLLVEPEIENCKELVVTFEDVLCRSSNIVGGKGASLALMTNLGTAGEQKFEVPAGACITKTAFQIHVEQNPKIEQAINGLQVTARKIVGQNTSDLEEECDRLVKMVTNSPISPRLKEELVEKLSEIFGEYESIRFAVRSSAIGEDGEEMSAAGQNETYLGVKGTDEILKALSKCWASQFAFRSVEYKRQNAQLFNMGMGVVIQRMVPAEVAGVLFSTHPLTGSYTQMLITANYGLGESVVSASADPDTIVIRRDHQDVLTVEEVTTGSKKSSIQMSEDGGTVELETEVDVASKCCLSEPMAILLAEIAVFLEKCFGNGRDIEWAIHQQKIYILQSRPVTTNCPLTDFEITHEFDSFMRTDNEFFSTANVAEVMPGSQTVLTASSVIRGEVSYFQKLFQWKVDIYKYDPVVMDGMGNYYGHTMFDLVAQKAWSLSKEKSAIMKAFDIGIYGHVLEDQEITDIAMERFEIRPPFRHKFVMMSYSLKGMMFGKRILDKSAIKFQNYRVPIIGTESIKECYDKIGLVLPDVFQIMNAHLSVTMASTMWNMIVLNILSQGKGVYSNDQYADFALLVGSCNGAESGNVPASLGELAESISRAEDLTDFANKSPEEALDNLRNTSDGVVTRQFKDFLNRHGHRGLKEFDLSCISWGIDPRQVVTVLQGMISNSTYAIQKPKEKSTDDVIGNIKSPLTSFKKRILRIILGFCQTGVCHRERAKSMVIKYFDAVRLAFRHLAKMMIKEGLILDEELIFFFTYEEIGQLIQTRSPLLIRRAKQRRKLFNHMDKLKFPEMITGFPRPINDAEEISMADVKAIIKGVPVSHGVIEGLARVVESFHDVHTIRPGEILITHATDIGWSPYFPMLSGIVTEIGGLISHGAVVAREFGLPCIVGVDNATKLFQSGDRVVLNATQGTIMKLQSA